MSSRSFYAHFADKEDCFLAATGATAELVRAEVRHGRIDAVRDLEDMLVDLHLAVLAAQPWGRPG